MGNCVESFGEVEKENVGLFVIGHGGSNYFRISRNTLFYHRGIFRCLSLLSQCCSIG